MSTHSNTLTRRTFLKGAAYTSALSFGSLSGMALADSVSPKQGTSSQANRTAASGLLAVNLSNQSDGIVALDARQPVSLEKVNGWVVVKINKAKPGTDDVVTGQHINLAAGQQCTFVVDAEVAPMLIAASTDIVITNEYSALDNMVPVTLAHTLVA